MQLLVTVVIPTYNSAKFIRDVLASVLAQTYPNIEIIVMDGASKDGTADIAREVAPNAIVISEPDRGQTHAINKGWTMANGDIVTWLCADDGYYPDTVANAVSYLEANPDAMWVYGLADHLDEHGAPSPMRHPVIEWNYEKLRDWANFIIQPATFLRREVIEQKGMPDEALHYIMDYEYWLRIGKDFKGHFVPGIRAWIKDYRETKTRSGGVKRFAEIEHVLSLYGGHGVPSLMRWEWVATYLSELISHLRQGTFHQIGADFREMLRYPAALPRAIIKSTINLFPPIVETQLRRLLIRSHDYVLEVDDAKR
jgi:glycosyltransferase involved in cell wall biosynthesis